MANLADDVVIRQKKPVAAAKKARAAKGSCGAGYTRQVHTLGMNIGKGYCAKTYVKKTQRAAKGSCGAGYTRQVHTLGMNIGKSYCAKTRLKGLSRRTKGGLTKKDLLGVIHNAGHSLKGLKSVTKTKLLAYIAASGISDKISNADLL